MQLTIGLRIFLALTAASLIVLTLNAAATRWNFERGFLAYVGQQELETINETAASLADAYRGDRGWDEFRREPRLWTDLLRESSGPPPAGPRGGRPPKGGEPPRDGRPASDSRPGGPPAKGEQRPPKGAPPGDPLDLGRRISLVDADGQMVVGDTSLDDAAEVAPIVFNGETVGYVTIAPRRELTDKLDRDFAREQARSIYLTGFAALLLAALVSAIVARQLTRPIRTLAAGARSISDGDFDTRIADDRGDELGDLAREFNALAQRLDKNRRARRQWVADIAHELRTPLAIMRGELEAIDDGVRQPDTATLKSLNDEAVRLSALVGELHELSILDEGGHGLNRAPVDLVPLLDGLLAGARNRFDDSGLAIENHLPSGPVRVLADEAKLERVFVNLLENTRRYTDTPGTLEVLLEQRGDSVMVEFADSAPGVPQGTHARLFDRLYRVDASRSRATGGSGLGLAICRAIAEAHGGTIAASPSSLGGVAIRLTLPSMTEEPVRQ